jgi:telomerase reverse transcriptase
MKRKCKADQGSRPPKKPKLNNANIPLYRGLEAQNVDHPVLSCYYDHVVTLRAYVLERLTTGENTRRGTKAAKRFRTSEASKSEKQQFDKFLDRVYVAYDGNAKWKEKAKRLQEFVAYSQALPLPTASTIGRGTEPSDELQTEVRNPHVLCIHINNLKIVHFAIWALFRKHPTSRVPDHLLCQGYERPSIDNKMNCDIPDVSRLFTNSLVETLTSNNWCHLLRTLGKGGDTIMADLLLDCAIFEPTNNSDPDKGNLYQLSGMLVYLILRDALDS